MLIKSADDKSKRLELLRTLQTATTVSAHQKKWLQDEWARTKKGIDGEREAAFYIDGHFENAKRHMVLHDLRFAVDDEVAQIDHLVIGSLTGILLIETKNYACNLYINARGEFTADYGSGRQFGIHSPLEQSRRHEVVLRKLLRKLEITGRAGMELEINHVVMLHPKAIIHRPPAKALNTDNIIKADQFASWHQTFLEGAGGGAVLKSMVNMRSTETIAIWGRQLLSHHQPADLLALPDFMAPAKDVPGTSTVRELTPPPTAPHEPQTSPPLDTDKQGKRLICAECGSKISYAEGKYCWNHPQRFGGSQYCREHQKKFTG